MVFPTSALLTGAWSTKPVLKLGPIARHEIESVSTTEAAVHALTLLEASISDAHRAHHGLSAIRSRMSGN